MTSIGCKKNSSGGTVTPPPVDDVNVRARAVPVTDTYVRDGARIEIHDGANNPNLHFSSDEKRVLYHVLDSLPIAHISVLKHISILPETDPFFGIGGQSTAFSTPGQIVYVGGSTTQGLSTPLMTDGLEARFNDPRLDVRLTDLGGLQRFLTTTVHEIGHNVEFLYISAPEQTEWKNMYSASETGDYFLGGINEGEDFAEAYRSIATVPGQAFAQSLLGMQSSGRTLLMQKSLYMASLFADPTSQKFSFLGYDGTVPQLYPLNATYQRSVNSIRILISCAGQPNSCAPVDATFTYDPASGMVSRVDFLNYSVSRTNPPKVVLNPTPFPLPQAFLSRLNIGISSTAATASRLAPITSEGSDLAVSPGSLIAPLTAESLDELVTDMGNTQVVSPNAPTFYVPVTTILPADGSRPVIKPTMEEMLRPHGAFQVSPKNN